MTKYEVKDQLSEYAKLSSETESIKKRIENLTALNVDDSEVNQRVKEVSELYKKAVLKTDIALARALEIIDKLTNTDCDAIVLKKYHIDRIPEHIIAKQLHFSVDYIRTKRWRAYKKLSDIL
jgi:DNA repair exonuclease SbcCD ATPase subunit